MAYERILCKEIHMFIYKISDLLKCILALIKRYAMDLTASQNLVHLYLKIFLSSFLQKFVNRNATKSEKFGVLGCWYLKVDSATKFAQSGIQGVENF